MKAVVVVLSVEAIPIGALFGVVFTCPLSRRSRFWLRFAAVLSAILLPSLVASLAPMHEQTAGIVLALAFVWGILLLASSRFVLFHGGGSDPGPDGEDGEGPDSGDDRPTPPAPIGGIPLPDTEPSLRRVRDHRPPRRASRPRRPTRPRERIPSRFWPLTAPVSPRLRGSWASQDYRWR